MDQARSGPEFHDNYGRVGLGWVGSRKFDPRPRMVGYMRGCDWLYLQADILQQFVNAKLEHFLHANCIDDALQLLRGTANFYLFIFRENNGSYVERAYAV